MHKCIHDSGSKNTENSTPDDIPGSENVTIANIAAAEHEITLPLLMLIATSVSDTCSNTSLEAVDSSSIVDDNDLIEPEDDSDVNPILKTGLITKVENILTYSTTIKDLLRKLHIDSSVLGSDLTKINFKITRYWKSTGCF